jgi:hypothetical protein
VKKIIIATLMLTLCLVFAQGAMAQWPDDPSANMLICNHSGEGTITKVSPAPDGGCYVSWWDNSSGNYDLYLQRLDGDGVSQWADNGLLISNHAQDTWLTDYDLDTDSAGYAILAINDVRSGGDWDIYAYRISPTGEFAWGANGVTISDNAAFEAIPSSVVTAAGNIVITWQEENILHIRKVTPEGTDFWNPATITLTYTYALSIPKLCAAETDDFIFQYLQAQGSGMYAQKYLIARKYDASGTDLWGSSGVVVTNAGGFGLQMRPDLVPDDSGGAISYWYDSRDNNLHAFVQHIRHDGSMHWTANGVNLNTTTGQLQMSPVVVFLPSGFTIAFFENTNSTQTLQGLYGQCLNRAGTRQWTTAGRMFEPMDNSTKMLLNVNVVENDAVVTYLMSPQNDAVNSYVMANRVDTFGNQVWDSDAQYMSTYLGDKGYLDACVNNRGQVITAWEDKRSDPDGDVYLQNINPNGSLGPMGPTVGTISGSVIDASGTFPVMGAIVVNFDSEDNITGIDTTGILGDYSFTAVAGTYHESFTKSSYRDTTITGIIVVAGEETRVSLYWEMGSNCNYTVGDINNSGVFNGIDVTYSVAYFRGVNPPPYSCDCNGSVWFVAGDVNGNCQFNGIDVTYMVVYFKGGANPIPCPACPPSR